MKHRIESTLLAAFLTTGPAIASAADDSHWYATANVGASFKVPITLTPSGCALHPAPAAP